MTYNVETRSLYGLDARNENPVAKYDKRQELKTRNPRLLARIIDVNVDKRNGKKGKANKRNTKCDEPYVSKKYLCHLQNIMKIWISDCMVPEAVD